jgi:hypothetical protein
MQSAAPIDPRERPADTDTGQPLSGCDSTRNRLKRQATHAGAEPAERTDT